MKKIFTLLAGMACLPLAAQQAKLPEIQPALLKNGMRVHLMPSGNVPLVHIKAVIETGAAADPAGKEGLASITTDLLQEGAGARDAQTIALLVDGWGAHLSTGSSHDMITIDLQVLSAYTSEALELMADLLMRPRFAEEDVARVKELSLAQTQAVRDRPDVMIRRAFPYLLYGDHPYGRPATGTLAGLGAITRQDLVAYHGQAFRPERAHLVMVGDVQPQKVLPVINRVFNPWKKGDWKAPALPPAPAQQAARFVLIHKPSDTQAQIRRGHFSIGVQDPRYMPFQVVNTPFGGAFTSWLNQEIRVKRGLSYGAGHRLTNQRGGAYSFVSTFTRNEKIVECLDVIQELLDKAAGGGLTAQEIEGGKAYTEGQYPTGSGLGPGVETFDDLASQVEFMIQHGVAKTWMDGRLDAVRAVTAEQAKDAAKLLDGSRDLTVLLGDKTVLLPLLGDKYGKIEVMDLDAIP